MQQIRPQSGIHRDYRCCYLYLILYSLPPSSSISCATLLLHSRSPVDEIGHLGRRKVKSRKGRPTCVGSATISCRSSNLVSSNFYFRAAAWMENCPWQKWNEMPYVGLALNHPIRPRVLRQLGAVELGAGETTRTRADKVATPLPSVQTQSARFVSHCSGFKS